MRSPIVIGTGLLVSLILNAQVFAQSTVKLPQLTAQTPTQQILKQNTQKLRSGTITLQRTACFGTCPIYKITIFPDGRVVYEGERFVKVVGKRTARISPQAVRKLVAEFDKLNYFSLSDNYQGGPTDQPSAITSLTIGKQQKTVNHYLGSPNASQALTALENKIDAVVNSQRWIGSKNDPAPNPLDANSTQLKVNRQLWNQQKLKDYSFTFSRSCFCVPKATQPVVITVRNGQVASITAVNNKEPVDAELFQQYNSIPKLFGIIEDAISRKAASLQVTYNPKLGYPTQINIDYNQQIADEELFLTISNLQPLN
ncbi:DUF6174 domain-containing protein [Nostoc sp. FACHB-110]|uniref:DUF6174 domain-containing protein n=1 Tax=Nostoc sp. FACHB-110 TaxID=2692834 RepID=UPI0016856748|nr:DUF6174 domain-containing protein [Nostoc sp. FACHB-110]MBD2439547.1 hypothetical protein [Nostoc sp. FACHB-110]